MIRFRIISAFLDLVFWTINLRGLSMYAAIRNASSVGISKLFGIAELLDIRGNTKGVRTKI